MTRKDYELIARILKEQVIRDREALTFFDSERTEAPAVNVAVANRTRLTIYQLAEGLRFDNPRFDQETFLKACGL